MPRTLQQVVINGNLTMALVETPTIPLEDGLGDGGDIMLSTAAAVVYNGLHKGPSPPGSWTDPSPGFMRWYLSSGSGDYRGLSVVAGDVVLVTNIGGSIAATNLGSVSTALQPADIASGTITARADDINLSGGSEGDVLTVQADGSLALGAPVDITGWPLVASTPSGWVAPGDGQASMYVANGVGSDVFSSGKSVAQGDVVLASKVGSTTKVWVFDYSEA